MRDFQQNLGELIEEYDNGTEHEEKMNKYLLSMLTLISVR